MVPDAPMDPEVATFDAPRRPKTRPSSVMAAALAIGLVSLGLLLPTVALWGTARADPPSTPVVGSIAGPTGVGTGLKANYVVHATGGPAFAPNGTQTGILAYRASIAALNTTGALISPTSGVLVNQTVTLSLIAPNLTESLTIYVLLTSSVSGTNSTNSSTNISYQVAIVQPYHVMATILVASAQSVGAFSITVTLDGQPVGSVAVPTLSPGASYPLSFFYVAAGLSSGWHTFAMNVAPEHGLVAFSGGSTAFTQQFYVPGSPPDNTVWYVAGASAFVAALFIFTTRLGARHRGKSKK
jgi:hypothetical protein